jgi:hypothetical protein
MHPVLDRQFSDLRKRHSQALHYSSPDGVSFDIIQVPNYPIGPGWSKQSTAIWFVVPGGYADGSRPDCFWADADLRLANGAMPTNSNLSPVPGLADCAPKLWFSWHLATWNSNLQTIYNYLLVCGDRFKAAK